MICGRDAPRQPTGCRRPPPGPPPTSRRAPYASSVASAAFSLLRLGHHLLRAPPPPRHRWLLCWTRSGLRLAQAESRRAMLGSRSLCHPVFQSFTRLCSTSSACAGHSARLDQRPSRPPVHCYGHSMLSVQCAMHTCSACGRCLLVFQHQMFVWVPRRSHLLDVSVR